MDQQNFNSHVSEQINGVQTMQRGVSGTPGMEINTGGNGLVNPQIFQNLYYPTYLAVSRHPGPYGAAVDQRHKPAGRPDHIVRQACRTASERIGGNSQGCLPEAVGISSRILLERGQRRRVGEQV